MVIPYSDVLADHIRTITSGVPINVISNCYDEEDYLDHIGPSPESNDGSFVISCVGLIGGYDLHMFFQALQELKAGGECSAMKARFVGAEERILRAYAARYDCNGGLEVVPLVPHKEAVRQMRQATCLLLPQIPFELPRRTPEYLAALRPILAFPRCPSAVSEPIIEQYGAAKIASTKEEIKAILLAWYQEFQSTKRVSAKVNEGFVQSFSARHRAEELNELLEEALVSGR